MKRLRLSVTLAAALVLCTSAWAQSYNFLSVSNPSDPNGPFTQLLGINNSMVIAGYHNFFPTRDSPSYCPCTSPSKTILTRR